MFGPCLGHPWLSWAELVIKLNYIIFAYTNMNLNWNWTVKIQKLINPKFFSFYWAWLSLFVYFNNEKHSGHIYFSFAYVFALYWYFRRVTLNLAIFMSGQQDLLFSYNEWYILLTPSYLLTYWFVYLLIFSWPTIDRTALYWLMSVVLSVYSELDYWYLWFWMIYFSDIFGRHSQDVCSLVPHD